MVLEYLRYEVRDNVAWITLNRPDRLNAVIKPLYDELEQALSEAENTTEVRVVVLTGSGDRAFCVGADMKEHARGERTAAEKRLYLKAEQTVCDKLYHLSKPVIAAVNGYALGAGAEMAVNCDFLLIVDDAEIGFPEVGIGAFLGGGVTYLLPRLIGLVKARELLYLGTRLKGTEAVSAGLAFASYSRQTFYKEVESFAQKMVTQGPISMTLLKEHLNSGRDRNYASALLSELEGMTYCSSTSDWREGVNAFTEKRKPTFTGK
jgi:enoyl-CoA hydratase